MSSIFACQTGTTCYPPTYGPSLQYFIMKHHTKVMLVVHSWQGTQSFGIVGHSSIARLSLRCLRFNQSRYNPLCFTNQASKITRKYDHKRQKKRKKDWNINKTIHFMVHSSNSEELWITTLGYQISTKNSAIRQLRHYITKYIGITKENADTWPVLLSSSWIKYTRFWASSQSLFKTTFLVNTDWSELTIRKMSM